MTEEKVNQLQKSSVVDWQLGKSGKVREDLKSSLAKTKNKSESKENGGHKAKESKSESGQVLTYILYQQIDEELDSNTYDYSHYCNKKQKFLEFLICFNQLKYIFLFHIKG